MESTMSEFECNNVNIWNLFGESQLLKSGYSSQNTAERQTTIDSRETDKKQTADIQQQTTERQTTANNGETNNNRLRTYNSRQQEKVNSLHWQITAAMDFSFNVNTLFSEEISVVRSDLIPEGYSGELNHSLVQQQVCQYKQVLYVLFQRQISQGRLPKWQFS